MARRNRFAAVLTGAVLFLVSTGAAQKPQVMVLGSYHMANPGRDYVNLQADDVLADKRQREIAEVVELLAAFRPTRIAIEVPLARQAQVDESYRGFRAGTHQLTRNESEQIGFRLAARLDHLRVYAVDHKQDLDVGGVMQWAQANGQVGLIGPSQAMLAAFMQRADSVMKVATVREILAESNQPDLDRMHGLYLSMARVGRQPVCRR